MEEILNMYSDLDIWMRVYWGCAVVSSMFFVVQTVLTFIGMDSSDIDVDFDGTGTMDLGDGLSLFSARNLVNFFCGAGWAGICLHSLIPNQYVLMIVSMLIGCCFVYMFFIIKKQTKKLEHNGAFEIADCIGKTTSVYLRIPAQRRGVGKVQVSINGSILEIDAMTNDGNDIASNSNVRITEVLDNHTVLVSSISIQ